MSESFSAFGFRVHKPWGPRKSGIPDSVEMPAPVNATTRRDCSTHSPASCIERRDNDSQDRFGMRLDFIEHAQPQSDPVLDERIGLRLLPCCEHPAVADKIGALR